MARFRFRFSKLLEIREHRKRSAEEFFAATLREWQAAELRAEQSARLADDALARVKQPGVYSVWQVGEGQRYAKMMRDRWQMDFHLARLSKGKVDEARRRLVEATKEQQVLERLRAKHLETHLAQEEAEQQKLLDDLGTIRYVKAQKALSQRRERGNTNG